MIEEVLSQKNENDVWKSIIYFFNKMIVVELNYQIYDKKFLAIVRVFEKWRSKLKDSKFFIQVIFDHKNLEYFMSFKLLNRRQARWFEFLSRFNFVIIYRSSNQNNVVDALNRQLEVFSKKEEIDFFMLQQVLKKNFDDELRVNYRVASIHLRFFNIDEKSISKLENIDFVFEVFLEDIRELNNFDLENLFIDDEKTSLKEQFQEVCDNDVDYRRIFKTLRDKKFRKIKDFSLVECELVND